MNSNNTTTLMLHSVGLAGYPWVYSHLSEPVTSFEGKMRFLKKAYPENSLFGEKPQGGDSSKRLVLTFDDGYLDNWVYAFPILRDLGLKATIFMTADFVDQRDVKRPLQENGKTVSQDEAAGFLSWPEMREMEKTGLIDIQPHALTHTWYVTGPQVVDYWRPGIATERKGAVWMLWNKYPEWKPRYIREALQDESKIPYGTPIYEHAEALVARRFHPESQLDDDLPSFVEEQGGLEFFNRPDWKRELDQVVDQSAAVTGSYESEEEHRERIRQELVLSKESIEKGLGKKVHSFCWPRGQVTSDVLALAREVGYEHFPMPSAQKQQNLGEDIHSLVPRMGVSPEVKWRGHPVGLQSVTEFRWRMKRSHGSVFHKGLDWLSKGFRLVITGVKLAKTRVLNSK